jgi:hypothetical protein
MARLDGDSAETDTWKDVSIVDLIDPKRLPCPSDRRKRASCADYRAILRPGEKILRRPLASLRRVGERKDNRSPGMLGHGANNAFEEGLGLARRTDEHRWTCVGHNLRQADVSTRGQIPSELFILVAIVFALVSAGAATVVATALASDAAMALAVR